MKIFLTGATGFIGSYVTRLAVRTGHEVYALVRKDSNLWRIEELIGQVNLVQANLMASNEIDACVAAIRPELCIHMAWTTIPGQYLSAPVNIDLLNASAHLASKLSLSGCRRFIGIGTCFEYDIEQGYFSEHSPTKPRSLYAACKLSLHLILEQLGKGMDMEVAWLRLFYQYGPGENPRRLVPSVICSLLAGEVAKVTQGEQVRDFLHVEDVAKAIWAVAQSELCGLVNVGSGQPVKIRSIVAEIGHILERTELIAWGALPYSSIEPMFVCANNRHLIENANWVPEYTLERGLEQVVNWWRENMDRFPYAR